MPADRQLAIAKLNALPQEIRHSLLVGLIGDTLKEVGESPSGPMYAACCDVVSLEEYQQIINELEQQGKIEVAFHYIKWIGTE